MCVSLLNMENGNRERKMEEGRRKRKFRIKSSLHTVLTSVVKETVTSRWICSLISETISRIVGTGADPGRSGEVMSSTVVAEQESEEEKQLRRYWRAGWFGLPLLWLLGALYYRNAPGRRAAELRRQCLAGAFTTLSVLVAWLIAYHSNALGDELTRALDISKRPPLFV